MLLLSVFLAVTLLQQHVFSSSQNVSGHLLPLIDNGHQQMKRWYGVEVPDPPNVPGGWGPWPVICSEPEQLQAIRYCFKDERSARNLQRIVDQVSLHWAAGWIVLDSDVILLFQGGRANRPLLVMIGSREMGARNAPIHGHDHLTRQ